MASFTVRMVLEDASWEDYEELHEHMKGKGFAKTITGSSGTRYQLPDAEYNYEGQATRSQVFEKAKAAAKATGLSYSVFVTEALGRTWCGLDKA